MESWNTRFDALEIDHLRSPAFAHPVAFEPPALINFAIREGRTSELIDAPTAVELAEWAPTASGQPVSGQRHGRVGVLDRRSMKAASLLITTDLGAEASLLKALPSRALFRDFCSSLEDELPHRWLSGTATSVCRDSGSGQFRVHYRATTDQRERRVVARAVILATGPVGRWNVPTPFAPHLTSRLLLHTEELIGVSGPLEGVRGEITRRCPGGEAARVLVIGGSLSAAQAALAALRAGHQVVLRSRRPLQTRAFDIASEWLDIRRADRLRYEFLSLPVKRRWGVVRQATFGGSVPAEYMEQLCRFTQTSTALRIEVDEEIDRSCVCVDRGSEHVVVNGEIFSMVILATGVVTAPSCSPLYHSVEELLEAPTVDGLPNVNNFLRWAPNEDLFVLGANAVLELGPGGGNLMGAMRGARVISNELHGLMWKTADGHTTNLARSVFSHKYAALLDGSEAEIDVLVRRLQLSPRAETALRKACKQAERHWKTTRGSRGGAPQTSDGHA